MASSGKKKTTMAKLTRESRLRERRVEKKARKEARKLAASQPDQPDNELSEYDGDQLTGDVETDRVTRADGGERSSQVTPPASDTGADPERELASPPAQTTAGE